MRRLRGLFIKRETQRDKDEEPNEDNNNAIQTIKKPKKKKCGCGCAELKIRSKELLWFDGKKTFVDCGLFKEDLSEQMTVEACIKRTVIDPLHVEDHQQHGHIVNQGGGWEDNGWSLFIYNGQLRIELQNSGHKTISDNLAPDRNEWAHVAFTWNCKTGQVISYVNGEQCASQRLHPTLLPKSGELAQHVNIGRNEKFGHYFNGFISDVRIWNKSLSPEQIEENSKCFKYVEGSHSGLVAYYPLDEGHGTEAICINNPNYNGTIANPLWVRSGFEPRPNISVEEVQIPPCPVTREWAGRKCEWSDVSINDGPNHIKCFPGTELTIKLRFRAFWNHNAKDYCPGCIVQLYYGMMDTFSEGVVEHGIHQHQGKSTKTFLAPNSPGIYYITQHISLDYHYVKMNPPNDPNQAIAVVQVVPLEWTPSLNKLFPTEIQSSIKAVLMLALKDPETGEPRHPDSPFGRVPKDVLYIIFQYLVE